MLGIQTGLNYEIDLTCWNIFIVFGPLINKKDTLPPLTPFSYKGFTYLLLSYILISLGGKKKLLWNGDPQQGRC